MTLNHGDGDSFVIPKMVVITVLLAVIGAVGTGGFYMGIQAANSTSMKETIQQLVSDRIVTDQAIADIKADIKVIKSKTDYGISKGSHL